MAGNMGGRRDISPIAKHNARQRKTLEKVFRKKTPSDMRIEEVKSLLKHMGYELESGGGQH